MSRKVNLIIAGLAVCASVLLFVTSGERIPPSLKDSKIAPLLHELSWPNTIVFNLSVGYLSSTIFWILVVYIPERSRRAILRNTLATQYQQFKQEVVQIFVWASGDSQDVRAVDAMAKDHVHFKTHFSSRSERWYAVLNGIQGSELRMHELLLAMEVFSKEVEYVLNNVPINDPSVHDFFKRINENIFRLRESESDTYDRVKHVGGFLWGILARWSIISGQAEEDVVEKMIARI